MRAKIFFKYIEIFSFQVKILKFEGDVAGVLIHCPHPSKDSSFSLAFYLFIYFLFEPG